MLKLAGCIMLISAGTCMGFYFSKKLFLQRNYLKALLIMSQCIGIYISGEFLTASEIFERLRENRELDCLDFLNSVCRADLTSDIAQNILDDNNEYLNIAKDKLYSYFTNFGKTDIQSQLAETEMLKRELSMLYENSKERCEKYSKLYRVLGFSAGALLSLILL